jgi:4-amino-4-deoxy-L-arabinose transferase-like glycosyltransferase
MDEQRSPASSLLNPPATFGRIDFGLLLLLLVIATGLRSWQLAHTEVASRDSIGYIRIAWRLEQEITKQRSPGHDGDWPQVVRKAAQHPGYPAALLLVSLPVRHFYSGDLALAMQWSAQLTSVFASVVLVVPMFLLGRGMFDRRAAFVGVLLFQCLPTSGRLMADGLSEPLFVLCACTAILFAHNGLKKGSPWWFAGVGLLGGLAYLTRPEGAFIIAATALVLVGLQAAPRWRRPWQPFLRSGALLAWGTLTIAGPFVLIVGHLTTKNTPLQVINTATAQVATKVWGGEEQEGPEWATDVVKTNQSTAGAPTALPTGKALWLFVATLGKGFFYVTWAPALAALFVRRDRFRLAPVSWVLLLISLSLGFFLYRVPVVMGYLSDRHTVLILFCATFWVAAGLVSLGDWAADRCAAWRPARSVWGRRPVWALALLVPLIAVALVKTLEPLHTDRIPYREAGHWLAQNASPADDIDDPYCWAYYYAGRVFAEDSPEQPHDGPRMCYVVIEQWPSDRKPRWPPKTPREKLRDQQIKKTWPVKRGKEVLQVAVYAVPE